MPAIFNVKFAGRLGGFSGWLAAFLQNVQHLAAKSRRDFSSAFVSGLPTNRK